MTDTAVWPIQVAVNALLQAVHPGQVHQEGEVTEADPLPYDILGTATEPGDSRRWISQPGLDQTLQITFWAETKKDAHQRFREGKAVLDGVDLTLAGYGRTVSCTLGLVTDIREPTPGLGGRGVVARLTTRTIET